MLQILSILGFVLLALVAPGAGLQRGLRLRVDPALVLPSGAAVAALAYGCALAADRSWLFPVLLAVTAGGLLRTPGRAPAAGARLPVLALLPPALALVLLFALTQYGGNRHAPDGGFLFDPMGDQPLHAGIARELTLPFPPQVPGLAGVPLHYHYGADLVRAAALRWAHVDPYDMLSRIEPTLWALALMLVLASLALRLGGSRLAAALAAWSLLATDLSFLCAPLRGTPWWSDVFRGNALISLAFANPVVPALMLALGAAIALARLEAGEGRAWLVVAVLQTAAVPFFKVFLGAQLGLAFGLAALVRAARAPLSLRTRAGWHALAPMLALALAAAPGVLWLAGGSGGEQVHVSLAPLRMVRDSLANLGFDHAGPGWLALLALPWIVVSLGLRVAGLPRAVAAVAGGSSAMAAVAWLALSGWPLGLLFHASARDIDGRELPSAAIYFVEQSGVVLWLFAALALAAWLRGRHRLALIALALVTLPSTIEFAARKALVSPDGVPAAWVQAVAAITRDAAPGARVLQRPGGRYPPLPVVLASQRVLYERFTPYLTQFAPAAELRRRHEALHRFFRTREREEALAIARALDTRYLCLYGADRVRFDTRGVLTPLYEDAGARSYRIEWSAGGARDPVEGAR